jgi:hypothetical protein
MRKGNPSLPAIGQYHRLMPESGLPYDRDLANQVRHEFVGVRQFDRRVELELTHRYDARLAAMQNHVRETPGCRATAVVHLGSGWGSLDCELIEMEGPAYWAWSCGDNRDDKPTGGPTLCPVDLRTALAALRSEHPRLRCLFEPMTQWQGRLTSLSIATADDGDWLIWGRSHDLNEPNVRESWAVMILMAAEYAARRA